VNALSREDMKYIATTTAGILFFGTPHRGSENASLGRLISQIGRTSGLDFSDRIIQDLEADSPRLSDTFNQFSSWLFNASTPVVCFFELRAKTILPLFQRTGKIVSGGLHIGKLF